MKTQVQYPFDPTTTAPYTIFKQVGSKTFFVNSKCVVSKHKQLTVGMNFLLIDSSKGIARKIRNCILVGCYYREGILHLILRDIRSQKVFTLDHDIQFPESDCTWLLIDLDYFKERENIKAIESYCGCGYNYKKHSSIEISQKSNTDDLLEFEF